MVPELTVIKVLIFEILRISLEKGFKDLGSQLYKKVYSSLQYTSLQSLKKKFSAEFKWEFKLCFDKNTAKEVLI